MTTTFLELYRTLQEKDPWQAVHSIQAYVMRALAWAFSDRLEATGAFQHTFLPDYMVHLQPGPKLAVHLRFSEVSALALAQSMPTKSRHVKHVILVNTLPDHLVEDRKNDTEYKRRNVLVTSFDIIDQIIRVVELVEEHGPYSTTLRIRNLQRELVRWFLDSYGWRPAPRLEDFIRHQPVEPRRTLRLRSTPVTVWVQRHPDGYAAYRYLRDSTSLGVRSIQKRSFKEMGRGASFSRVNRIRDVAKPTVLLTWTDQRVHIPVLACTFTRHAPMGQNAFQILPQAVACAEIGTPFILVAPEKAPVRRMTGEVTVEKAHPLLYQALTRMMHIYRIPILMLPWPTDDDLNGLPTLRCDRRYPSLPDRATSAIQLLFRCVDFVLEGHSYTSAVSNLLGYYGVSRRRLEMEEARFRLGMRAIQEPPRNSGLLLHTGDTLSYIRETTGVRNARIPFALRHRPTTVVFTTRSKSLRADPYLGTLLAFDFAFCRTGPSVVDRSSNLFAQFQDVHLDEALTQLFENAKLEQPRFNRNALFLQYADALIFKDGMVTKRGDKWVVYR